MSLYDDVLLCDKMHFDAKEAYKLLRTNLLFCLPENKKCRVIGVTSSIRGEGKSTTAINISYTISQNDLKVLLIEMDLRLPSLGKKINLKSKFGFSDYIIGTASKEEVINKSDLNSNWDIILSGSIPPNPSELLCSDKVNSIIQDFSKDYDFIILDLPPVTVVTDAMVVNKYIDGLIVVVRQDYSDKKSLAECMNKLKFVNSNILGFVVTDSGHNGKYYNRKYRYYSRYGNKYYRRYRKDYRYDYDYYESNDNLKDQK